MNNDTNTPKADSSRATRPEKKKCYSAPRILLRENVEVIAADCTAGKSDTINCSSIGVLIS